MIELKNVSKEYLTKAEKVIALYDINISLPNEGLIFVLGKSGCGKSTLLNVIGGLDDCTRGEIVVDGVAISEFNLADYDEYRNYNVGLIFQDYNLLEECSVNKNISIALELQGIKEKEDIISSALESVGLAGYGKRKISELSGGQKQRVAIARALVKSPKIILADEPTGNLDSVTSKEIFSLLREVSKTKLVVLVSHDKISAEKYADRIISLLDGKVVSDVDNATCKQPVAGITENELSYNADGLVKIANMTSFERYKEDYDNTNNSKRYRKKRKENLGLGTISGLTLNSMRYRWLRLLVITMLMVVAVTTFGVFLGIERFDSGKVAYDAYRKDIGETRFSVEERTIFQDSVVSEMNAKYSQNNALVPIYASDAQSVSRLSLIYDVNFIPSNSEAIGITACNEEIMDKNICKVLLGKMPSSTYEIALPRYLANEILSEKKGFALDFGVKEIEDFIDKTIYLAGFGEKVFTIVGLIDTHDQEILADIEKRAKAYNNDANFIASGLWEQCTYGYSIHKAIVVDQTFIDSVYKEEPVYPSGIEPRDEYVRGVACYSWSAHNSVDDNGEMLEYLSSVKIPVQSIMENDIFAITSLTYRLTTASKYVIVAFVLFATLLMLNYLFTSIKDCHRRTGILLSLGANNIAVGLIHFIESVIVALLVFVISSIIIAPISLLLSGIAVPYIARINIISVGAVEILSMLALPILLAVIGNVIPIIANRKKKPIDIIRNK